MIGATGIAVFFIPMFFFVLETLSERRAKTAPGSGSDSDSPPAHSTLPAEDRDAPAPPSARQEDG